MKVSQTKINLILKKNFTGELSNVWGVYDSLILLVQITKGLHSKYGDKRVLDTPITEVSFSLSAMFSNVTVWPLYVQTISFLVGVL